MSTQKCSACIVSFLLLLTLTLGCSRRSADDKMADDIREKVAADPETRDSKVTVKAKEGKVTLSGKVKSPSAQKRVEEIANEQPGRQGLDDQTTIDPELESAMSAAPPPEPKPAPKPIVVPSGTSLTVTLTAEVLLLPRTPARASG